MAFGAARSAALALAALVPVAARASPQDEAATRARFLAFCAACHGESGDGRGTTPLERPARSFLEGGFSYGNTPEAVLRSITHGIPGTAMPAFEGALPPAEREALARYVVALGPPQEEVRREATVLRVGDRPRFAYGHLPPIVEGAPAWPRGLLVGTTAGLTFEFRIDDVRLLGVRVGDFVERTDWIGRGGTPLKPLGQLVQVLEAGNPRATFSRLDPSTRARSELRARFLGTSSPDGRARVAYELRAEGAAAPVHVRVVESLSMESSEVGTGYARALDLRTAEASEPVRLVWHLERGAGGSTLAGSDRWIVRRTAQGELRLYFVRASTLPRRWIDADAALDLELDPSEVGGRDRDDLEGQALLEVVVLFVPAWDDAVRARWEAELRR